MSSQSEPDVFCSINIDPNDGLTDQDRMHKIEQLHDLDRFNKKWLSPEQRHNHSIEITSKIVTYLQSRGEKFCGFQANQTEDYHSRLGPMMNLHVNNIGDPFSDVGGFRLNTKAAERAILKYWSELWVGEVPDDAHVGTSKDVNDSPRGTQLDIQPSPAHSLDYTPESMDDAFFHSTSGYVCSFGSTEGNLWSLRQARDYLKGKFLFTQLYGDLSDSNFGPSNDPMTQSQQEAIAVHLKRQQRYEPTAALIPKKNSNSNMIMNNSANDKDDQVSSLPPHLSAPSLPIHPNSVHTPIPTETPISTPTSALSVLAKRSKQTTPGLSPHHPRAPNGLQPLLPPHISFNERAFREPIILYSNSSHYSIGKIKDMLEVHDPCTFIRAFYTNHHKSIKPSDCFGQLQQHKKARDEYCSQLQGNEEHNDEVVKLCKLFQHDDQLTIEKYLEIFGKDEFPHQLPTYEDGTMNLEALRFMVRFFYSLGNPVIISLNYGTTFTGAHDNPKLVQDVITTTPGCHAEGETEEHINGVTYTKLTRRNYYIHCDGALGAAYGAQWEENTKNKTVNNMVQYMEKYKDDSYVKKHINRLVRAQKIWTDAQNGIVTPVSTINDPDDDSVINNDTTIQKTLSLAEFIPLNSITLPTFTFRNSGVMSISMSGHKFIGSPNPSGVAMSLRKYMLDFLSTGVTYISSPDTTISGSRSGLNVMIMYDYLTRHGIEMEAMKYCSGYNLAQFAANIIAFYIKSTALFVARDKPQKHWLTPFYSELQKNQDEQYAGKNTTLQTPLVFNFPGSLSVIFPQPSYQTRDKYSLSCDVMTLPRKYGYKFDEEYLKTSPIVSYNPHTDAYTLRCAHIFSMESLSVELINELAQDLGNDPYIIDLIKAIKL